MDKFELNRWGRRVPSLCPDVLRSRTWDLMEDQKWPPVWKQIIQLASSGSKTKIYLNGATTEVGRQRKGIKQGAPESPVLFAMIMDKIISPIRSKYEYRIGRENLIILMYADDILVLHKTPEVVEEVLEEIRKALWTIGLEINRGKTQYITNASQKRPLFVHKWVLEPGEALTHLGIRVNKPMIPPKAEEKIRKITTWAEISTAPGGVKAEIVMTKVMGSVAYYSALTTMSKRSREKMLKSLEHHISKAAGLKSIGIEKAVKTGILPPTLSPRVELAKATVRQ